MLSNHVKVFNKAIPCLRSQNTYARASPVQASGDPDIQNAYYNGYLCACYVSNVLVFAPNGKIIFAAINQPNSWHDSQVARNYMISLGMKLQVY
jgi:hypothetical protein